MVFFTFNNYSYQQLIIIKLVLLLLLFPSEGMSKTYKYIDEQGQTHYSDKLPESSVKVQELKNKITKQAPSTKDLKEKLNKKFPTNNPVEVATLATVEISSEIGQGSGFFFSNDGYIVTNKHVIKSSQSNQDKNKKKLAKSELFFEIAKERLYLSEKQHNILYNELITCKSQLKRNFGVLGKRSLQARCKTLNFEYQVSLKNIRYLESDYYAAKKEFERSKSFLLSSDRNPYWGQRYTIRIKDGTELEAEYISASKDYDLAFLKLKRYMTPFLVPLESGLILRGSRVHAIGSPLGISDSLSTGTVTSVQGGVYLYRYECFSW